jgi:hypothetical protein
LSCQSFCSDFDYDNDNDNDNDNERCCSRLIATHGTAIGTPAHPPRPRRGHCNPVLSFGRQPTRTGGDRPVGNLIVTGITFGVFMTEALIHYNMGQTKSRGKFELTIPPPAELAKIAAVTLTFSVVTGLLVKALPKNVQPKI